MALPINLAEYHKCLKARAEIADASFEAEHLLWRMESVGKKLREVYRKATVAQR